MESEDLIAAVQKCQALYDKADDNYSNRNYVNNKWKEIGEELGVDDQTARKKWTTLRDYFQKQHRLMMMFKSGSTAKKKRKWFLYDNMQFLVPHIKGDCKISSNMTDSDDDDGLMSHSSMLSASNVSASADQEDVQEVKPEQKALGLSFIENGQSKNSQEMTAFSSSNLQIVDTTPIPLTQVNHNVSEAKATEDEDELFFKSLLPKMKMLDPITKMECQGEIHMTVLKYLKQAVRDNQLVI